MVFETNIICFGHMKHMKKKPNSQDECGVGERGGIIVCGRWTRSARPRGLGGDFEFLPLKSPRNPITPIETTRVETLDPGLYTRFREGARRVIGATAKPLYPIDGKAEGLDRRNPRPPSSREGDRPVGGGRSSQAPEGVRPHRFYAELPSIFRYTVGIRGARSI